MKTGPYEYINVKTFRGMEGHGAECDIRKDGRKFAYYHDDGNGGEGRLEPLWDEDEGKWKANRALADEFMAYAYENCPEQKDIAMDDPVMRSEHLRLDLFMGRVIDWCLLEKQMKSFFRKLPTWPSLLVFFDADDVPLYFQGMKQQSADAAEAVIRAEISTGRYPLMQNEAKFLAMMRGDGFEGDAFPVLKTISEVKR